MVDEIRLILEAAVKNGDITGPEASRIDGYCRKRGGGAETVLGVLSAHHGLTPQRRQALTQLVESHNAPSLGGEVGAVHNLPGQTGEVHTLPGQTGQTHALPGQTGETHSLPGSQSVDPMKTMDFSDVQRPPRPPQPRRQDRETRGFEPVNLDDAGFQSFADGPSAPPPQNRPRPRGHGRPTQPINKDAISDALRDTRQAPPKPAKGVTRKLPPKKLEKPPVENIGGCKLEKLLGKGAMGAVYLGYHAGFDQQLAVKLLPEERTKNRKFVDLFLKEARSLVKIAHPNVVRVFNVGEENSKYFIAMELVEGSDLGDLIKAEKTVEPRRAAEIIAAAAQGLHAAHLEGMVHRDVKPDNLMITNTGLVKVADFGLAIETDDGSKGGFKKNNIVGTPYYMPPEQVDGEPADARADIYSLGCTLYHALTGDVPYRGKTLMDILVKHVNAEPCDPREKATNCPDDLAKIALKMMAKLPGRRYQNMQEVANDLNAFVEGRQLSSESGPGGPAKKIGKSLADLPPVQLPPPPQVKGFAVSGSIVLVGAIVALIGFNYYAVNALVTTIPTTPATNDYAFEDFKRQVQSVKNSEFEADKLIEVYLSAYPKLADRIHSYKHQLVNAKSGGLDAKASERLFNARAPKIKALAKTKDIDKAVAMFYAIDPQARAQVSKARELERSLLATLQKTKNLCFVENGENSFLIDKYEVSNADYAKFLAANESVPTPKGWQDRKPPSAQENLPMVSVTLDEAKAYAAWAGKRLPTLEEWRVAAQGKTSRPYPWGEYSSADLRRVSSRQARKGPKLAEVDAFSTGELTGLAECGAANMSGNAAEWVVHSAENQDRGFVCGGSFKCQIQAMRVDSSIEYPSKTKREDIGFRCVQALPTVQKPK